MKTVNMAFSGGWNTIKLYFMIGLPTETMDDVAGIAELGQKVVNAFYSNPNKPKGRGVSVTLSASSFVPKPFTPFQWEPQDPIPLLHESSAIWCSRSRRGKSPATTTMRTPAFWRLCLHAATAAFALCWKKRIGWDASLTDGTIIFRFHAGWRRLKPAGWTRRFMPTAAGVLMRCFPGTIWITASERSS